MQRVDTRFVNKYIEEPMKLIIELKENFSRENKFIVETVKANNEKYIKKMG